MSNILITGAANGLGAAFLEAYRRNADTHIHALDFRTVETKHENVTYHVLDVTIGSAVLAFATKIQDIPIDLLIHSAGIRGLVSSMEDQKPEDVAACEILDVMDIDTMTRTFQINALGTFSLLRALLPNLRRAKDAKVVILSSRMGSIGNNQLPNKDAGSAYAYRASKAALNMIVRSLAVDVPEVTFVLCHPGRVETKLVRCKEVGAISAEESVRGLLPLIEKWSKADSGLFYDRFGERIEW